MKFKGQTLKRIIRKLISVTKRNPRLKLSFIAALIIHVLLLVALGLAWMTDRKETVHPRMIDIRIAFEMEPPTEEPVQLVQEALPQDENPEATKIVKPKNNFDLPKVKKPEAKKPKQTTNSSNNGSIYGNTENAKLPDDYTEFLQLTVQEISRIPKIARDKKMKGNAILRMSFNRAGYVLRYSLVKKTGNKVLDQAALDIGNKLMTEPFPPVPEDFDPSQEILYYDFPISFDPNL